MRLPSSDEPNTMRYPDPNAETANSVPQLRTSFRIATLLVFVILFSGCQKAEQPEDIRPVRTIVVEERACDESIAMSGQIEAHNYINAAFRTSGRMIERLVTVGDRVKSGQPLARLDPKIEKAAVGMAEADLTAAKALLQQTESQEKRLGSLVRLSAASQMDYEDAVRQFKAAQSQVKGAEARLQTAQEQLDFTLLKAEADGVVTERLVDVGDVVAAGQTIVRIAKNGLIDAVFDVPEALIRGGVKQGSNIEVRLNADKSVRAVAIVYELAPQSDVVTRTHLTKATLSNPPAQMLLGANIVGHLRLPASAVIQVPSSSLTVTNGVAAVWVVDPAGTTVQLRPIQVGRYTTDGAIVTGGLTSGDRIVTAGVQMLHQNQKVKILGERNDRS